MGPEKKGRIYVRVQIPGGQRSAVTGTGERERSLRQRKTLLLTFRDELHVVVKVGCDVGLFL